MSTVNMSGEGGTCGDLDPDATGEVRGAVHGVEDCLQGGGGLPVCSLVERKFDVEGREGQENPQGRKG